MKRILRTQDDDDAIAGLQQWSRYKHREAQYVQVAGAVMFASVVGCLSWPAVQDTHWAGPALWYTSLVLALCSVLTGAQQTLVLVSDDVIAELSGAAIQEVKRSLASGVVQDGQPSAVVAFSWQVPIMLLCYAIFAFLGGLCSVVYSPLARSLAWNNDTKTAVLFSVGAVVCAFSWSIASLVVMRLSIPGNLMTDARFKAVNP